MPVEYAFDDLPVNPIDAGRVVLVAGQAMTGARDLARRLSLAGVECGEGALVVSTTGDGQRILDDCRRHYGEYASRVGVVSCVGDYGDDAPDDARLACVSSPGDLTGIGIEYSGLYQTLHDDGADGVRTTLDSISTLLAYSDLQTVSRFVHTLGGRVKTADGLGAFVIDPSTHDERAVNTISHFCDGRIDVREGDDGRQLRVRGLPDQPRDWTSVEL